LAERQGLLNGKRLSEVQQLGLEILMLADDIRREKDDVERMRHALLTANPALAAGLYPEYFEPEDEDAGPEVDLNRENASYDFRKVEFESPQNMADEELAAIQRLLGNSGVTVGMPVEAPEGMEDASGVREPEEPDWT
jgi:hypothetical protein